MAEIVITKKLNDDGTRYSVENVILVRQNFMWVYDLDFGNMSFDDTYGEDGTVADLLKWLRHWNGQFKKRNEDRKFITGEIDVCKNRVLPSLKASLPDWNVSFESTPPVGYRSGSRTKKGIYRVVPLDVYDRWKESKNIHGLDFKTWADLLESESPKLT